MTKLFSIFMASILFLSTTGFAAGVCDEFVSTNVQADYPVVSYNEQGSCVMNQDAFKHVDDVIYIGEVTEGKNQFRLYETVDGEFGLFVVVETVF